MSSLGSHFILDWCCLQAEFLSSLVSQFILDCCYLEAEFLSSLDSPFIFELLSRSRIFVFLNIGQSFRLGTVAVIWKHNEY